MCAEGEGLNGPLALPADGEGPGDGCGGVLDEVEGGREAEKGKQQQYCSHVQLKNIIKVSSIVRIYDIKSINPPPISVLP